MKHQKEVDALLEELDPKGKRWVGNTARMLFKVAILIFKVLWDLSDRVEKLEHK